jgi:hypothetical protein
LEANSLGDSLTQVISFADVNVSDGQYLCAFVFPGLCPAPTALELDLDKWFTKPKPANTQAPPPSGKKIKVLHLSDFHLDPRYKNGAEADCSTDLCCRSISNNTASPDKVVLPAPRYGSFLCDSPMDLAGVAVEAIPAVVGGDIAFTVFTGDLTSHDINRYGVHRGWSPTRLTRS